ncbi:GNAT family N-acetyltransferase [Parafilimonas sp.]|uniref:GNAT family N-acetyltransferase n=1 Tax=Parafilimonas sp. TaxID=1969739 RepID=UPI0039E66730
MQISNIYLNSSPTKLYCGYYYLNMNWHCKAFNDLSPLELYKILQLRSEVFVVEQNCIFLDMDNKDEGSLHCVGFINGGLAAYARLAPPGYIYTEISIGRVVTSPRHRSKGLGKELMQRSIELCRQYFGNGPIKIGAQYYLLKFYASLGFKVISDIYLEDGIAHVHMVNGR